MATATISRVAFIGRLNGQMKARSAGLLRCVGPGNARPVRAATGLPAGERWRCLLTPAAFSASARRHIE
jgi:hypothetical protein